MNLIDCWIFRLNLNWWELFYSFLLFVQFISTISSHVILVSPATMRCGGFPSFVVTCDTLFFSLKLLLNIWEVLSIISRGSYFRIAPVTRSNPQAVFGLMFLIHLPYSFGVVGLIFIYFFHIWIFPFYKIIISVRFEGVR